MRALELLEARLGMEFGWELASVGDIPTSLKWPTERGGKRLLEDWADLGASS